jgi:hypothetical protein
VVLGGLDRCWGVSVQPQTGTVYVAETAAGRVGRLVDGKLEAVVVDFPRVESDDEALVPRGPQRLAFLNPKTLVVGCVEEVPCLYIVEVSAAGSAPVRADVGLRLVPPADRVARAVPGCLGLAATRSFLTIGWHGHTAPHGWAVAAIRDRTRPVDAESYAPWRQIDLSLSETSSCSVTSIAASPRGEFVLGVAGEIDGQADSRLVFVRPADGRVLLDLATGLYDLSCLTYGAYEPRSTALALYALDLAWEQPGQGGLFRLDAALAEGRPTVSVVRMASLERPTAMAVAQDGSLYVAVLGPRDTQSDRNTGRLLRFASGWQERELATGVRPSEPKPASAASGKD